MRVDISSHAHFHLSTNQNDKADFMEIFYVEHYREKA